MCTLRESCRYYHANRQWVDGCVSFCCVARVAPLSLRAGACVVERCEGASFVRRLPFPSRSCRQSCFHWYHLSLVRLPCVKGLPSKLDIVLVFVVSESCGTCFRTTCLCFLACAM